MFKDKSNTKKMISPISKQRAQLEALLAQPDQEIELNAPLKTPLPPPPEFIGSFQGSTSGAASGEFHVYKNSKRREWERQKEFKEDIEREEAQKEFEIRRAETMALDDTRTEKKRLKREKAKRRRIQQNKSISQEFKVGVSTDFSNEQKSRANITESVLPEESIIIIEDN